MKRYQNRTPAIDAQCEHRGEAPLDQTPSAKQPGEPKTPNKAMERSRILVTDRADARSAPSIRLAHLGR
jgi:hypothetical protein